MKSPRPTRRKSLRATLTDDPATVERVETTAVRDRSAIEKYLADLENEMAAAAEWDSSDGYTAPSHKERNEGHLAAFRWILYGGPAPFTGKTFDQRALWQEGDPPSELALAFEKRAVLDELFPGHRVTDPRPSGRTVSWLHAVELTLDWALGRDDRNPLTSL
jgi:hypothetical protein